MSESQGFWHRLLWGLVFPRSRLRVQPTLVGTILVGLSFGLGVAAYNSSNNILFITLSILLACLIFSGVLSWINLRGVEWDLRADPPWRAGQEGVVEIALTNTKRLFPVYGLWFDMRLIPVAGPAVPAPRREDARTDRRSIRQRLAAMEQSIVAGVARLAGRLDPSGEADLDWSFTAANRGRWRLELASAGTDFPFGFLRKRLATGIERDLCVWPSPVSYQMESPGAGWAAAGGERARSGGNGVDLLSLRQYAPGDSHRLIHWKASARQRQLLVRQLAAEQQEGYLLRFEPAGDLWPRSDQFELAVSLAATLSEDLFRAGRLRGVALGAEHWTTVRRLADLEGWLDRLSVVTPTTGRDAKAAGPAGGAGRGRQTLVIQPEGTRRVAAYLDGRKAASA